MATLQLFDEEVLLSLTTLGKFDEIFQLQHILRIIYDLDVLEISDINIFKSFASSLVIQDTCMKLLFLKKENFASIVNLY